MYLKWPDIRPYFLSAMSTVIVTSPTDQPYLSLPAKLTAAPVVLRNDVEMTLPRMVAAHAAASPQAAAVVSGGEVLTYAELDRRANQLANRLVGLGVGEETIVALCLDRSPESVMCALAVLKAGGAYLPLDPKYPIERLTFTLNDAQPRVLITKEDLTDQFSHGSWEILTIDRDSDIDNSPIDAPLIDIDKSQLAYVIYTSGSTGQPKGVEITHGSLLNLVSWHQIEFEVTSQDRATHLASVGFDASVWEVWPHLTAGATLFLPDDETRLSPTLLRDWLVANQITISFLPTALAEAVMTLDWPVETALRFLLTGADTLHRHPRTNQPFIVVNNYGPTECTIVTTSGNVESESTNDGLPTIGRPIANTVVHILDEKFQPVASGEAGELYVGGISLARGYLNRPDLTAEKFVPDPFSAKVGARLYRTGDKARRLANGDYAYLGRIDDQIKIRGYRIEPAEIEAAINRHPAIASSVVVTRSADCSEKRLTAYLAMRNGPTPAATELREFLSASLPDYMLPSQFVNIPALPLTNNGKVNRSALPKPTIENTLRDEDFVAARSPIEQKLSTIVCSLLNLEKVSVNDNFFLLGGHSLLGTQLIVKIRSAFGVDLALRLLFEAPTIAELSSEIERLIIARVESMTEEEAERLLA
jgi:amino acid adenylation domain-containing protein